MNRARKDAPKLHDILRLVARTHGVTVADLKGPAQERLISQPRHVAMWLCSRHSGRSLPVIGYYLNRDHTTVLNGILNVEHRIANGLDLTRLEVAVQKLPPRFPVIPKPAVSESPCHETKIRLTA